MHSSRRWQKCVTVITFSWLDTLQWICGDVRHRGRRRKAPPSQTEDEAPGKPENTEQRDKPAATHRGRAKCSGANPKTQSSRINP
jgi:hypothetical protein